VKWGAPVYKLHSDVMQNYGLFFQGVTWLVLDYVHHLIKGLSYETFSFTFRKTHVSLLGGNVLHLCVCVYGEDENGVGITLFLVELLKWLC